MGGLVGGKKEGRKKIIHTAARLTHTHTLSKLTNVDLPETEMSLYWSIDDSDDQFIAEAIYQINLSVLFKLYQ